MMIMKIEINLPIFFVSMDLLPVAVARPFKRIPRKKTANSIKPSGLTQEVTARMTGSDNDLK